MEWRFFGLLGITILLGLLTYINPSGLPDNLVPNGFGMFVASLGMFIGYTIGASVYFTK